MALVKLVATDLDGTLLNSRHEISKENIAALRWAEAKGAEIVIVTGRTYADARAICEKAAVTAHIISNNGSAVHLKDGKKLRTTTIEKPLIQKALHWLHENQYYYEIATDDNTYFCLSQQSFLKMDFDKAKAVDPALDSNMLKNMLGLLMSQTGILPVHALEEIFDTSRDYCKIVSVCFDKSKLLKGKEYFRRREGLSLITSHPFNFELVSSDASKGNALEYLSHHLNISLDHVMAVGDNYNDISMFDKAGISVAMGNAEDDIKKRCSFVALSNEQHGVAYAIQQLL